MSDNLALFVNVILPLPLQKLYTYRVPREFESLVVAGKRVVVQFGKKKLYTAVVHSVQGVPPAGYEAKYILEVLDETPVISPEMLRFWEWLAKYYLCTPGDVMQAALPAGLKPESQTSVSLNEQCDLNVVELSDKEYLIVEALTRQSVLQIDEISEIVQVKNVFGILRSLVLKEVVVMNENLEPTYKPKFVTCVRLNIQGDRERELELLFASLAKKEGQLNMLMALLMLEQETEQIEKSVLLKRSQSSESSLKSLVSKGVVELYSVRVDRVPLHQGNLERFNLNEVQEQAYQSIKQQEQRHEVTLLHGVTSSGKTHVYVKLIEEQLALNKQCLLLLPEIALTSQVVARIRKYFGDDCVAFHSRFSPNERVELWHKIRENKVKVIIGARSAVFLPFSSLGLVIVDEEHESSYKQHDPAPRYHARDAAIYLAFIWKCKTILGSATPSYESYFNAQAGKYGLVKMTTRFGEIGLPVIETANIAEETRTKTMRGHFTSVLYNKIREKLDAGEQVILFQNRRGYAPVIECQTCHHIPRCKNCDISLTYHKYNDSLKCHYCGYQIGRMTNCVACDSPLLDLKGFGTEKVEDELHVHFPEARIARLDLDAAKSKHGHQEIIRSFEAHESDILVGTQMLSKGLDFGKVTLVGVINADQLLFFPDFRAYERTFQLLSQVSGRAGRGQVRGEVIIQTSVPSHEVLQDVIHHRYEPLYEKTLAERNQYFYPPYSRLIRLVIRHKDAHLADEAAFHLYQQLYPRFGEYAIGPEAPYVSRVRNLYVREILVKINRDSQFLVASKQFIRECIQRTLVHKTFKHVIVHADVDPL